MRPQSTAKQTFPATHATRKGQHAVRSACFLLIPDNANYTMENGTSVSRQCHLTPQFKMHLCDPQGNTALGVNGHLTSPASQHEPNTQQRQQHHMSHSSLPNTAIHNSNKNKTTSHVALVLAHPSNTLPEYNKSSPTG